MLNLIDSLQKWVRRNQTEDDSSKPISEREICMHTREVRTTIRRERILVVCFISLITGVIDPNRK